MKLVIDKFKSGGLHEKHVVATWNHGSTFTYRHRETKKNLCRGGRSQDLLVNAFWLVIFYYANPVISDWNTIFVMYPFDLCPHFQEQNYDVKQELDVQ